VKIFPFTLALSPEGRGENHYFLGGRKKVRGDKR